MKLSVLRFYCRVSRLRPRAVFLGTLLFGSCLSAAEDWKVVVDWDGQVFPSYIIATATRESASRNKLPADYLGDPNGYIGVEYVPEQPNEEVKVEIVGGELLKSGIVTGTITTPGKRYRIYPKAVYNYQKLGRLWEPATEDLTVTLTVNGQVKGTKVKTVRFRSVNDCPLALLDTQGRVHDYSWMFAAYVNENHPLIDSILSTALKNGLVRNFKGYQGSPADVYEEIFAIWNTVQRAGVKYSDITTPSGVSDKVFSQHVRKLEDCLSNSQANCVDGSALFASAFRKIGLHTSLVLIPGHCFLLVNLDDARRQPPLVIETTAIGNADLKKQSIDRGLNSLLSGRSNNLSRTSFEQAVAIGAQEYNKAIPYFGKAPHYHRIDIEQARKHGVLPLNSSGS